MHNRPVKVMDNPKADRVKRVVQLAGRSAVRNRRQQFLVEGPQSATEAIMAHLGRLNLSETAAQMWPADNTITEVYYTQQLSRTDRQLYNLVGQLNDRVFVAETSSAVMQAMSDAVVHQNIVVVANLPSAPLSPQCEADLACVLVRIQDPGNAGTIIRTADASGADYVVATSQTVDFYNPKTVRSTAGSLFHLPVYTQTDLATFVSTFHGQTLAADGYGDYTLDRMETCVLANPTAWLFGNEARGLAEHELALADRRVAVPLYGLAESLNVATAATICLYASAMAQSIS